MWFLEEDICSYPFGDVFLQEPVFKEKLVGQTARALFIFFLSLVDVCLLVMSSQRLLNI